MAVCPLEKIRAARQRVINQLAEFRADPSSKRLAALKAGIENWHVLVSAWNEAAPV